MRFFFPVILSRAFKFSILRACLALGPLGVLATGAARAATDAQPGSTTKEEFLPAIQLAPFVVNGERLSISIHARTKSDRRYGEKFAEDVIEVVYATLDNSPGAGLVIIGAKDEPHPVFVFRKFLALSDAGQLQPSMTASADELRAMMQKWESRMQIDDQEGLNITFDSVVKALPLPLEGVGSKLYQLAWAEQFNDERVELKLRALTPDDLKDNQLSRFDWVFYLPPRRAFDEVLKTLVPAVLKKEELGLFKRAAIRSALVVFRPAIKTAIEGARKGMLYMTVLRARSSYTEDDILALMRAYMRVLMPDFKFNGHKTHERAVEAIEAQKIANAEYARDPFVSPKRLTEFDPASYAKCEGEYAEERDTTHRFARTGEAFTWQYLDHKPKPFYPAGERLFVSEKGEMTIEFLVNDAGEVTGVEERWVRRRKTVPRQMASSPL